MKTRRGLSTVVGMVFSIIALTTTVAYVSYSMNSLNQYNQTVLTKNQQLGNAASEKFQISSVAVSGSKLNITLANTGTLPVNFTKIWVQNTSATNWVNSYTPPTPKGFVSPGATLTNLGQNIGVYINPTKSYNVKLVTSRGTSQSFSVNSPGSSKLNIQFMFLPATISAGFNSTLAMIVTNNSTGMLTNISPSPLPTPTTTGSAVCTASSVTPSQYATLAPGSTAIFTWSVKATGGGADTCSYKYSATPPLQNGYMQTVQANATVTVVSLASTSYSQSSGVLTTTYTAFQWTEGAVWNSDWSFPSGTDVIFSIQITNNNQTSGGYSLFVSQNSQLFLSTTSTSSSAKNVAFCIVAPVTTPPTPIGTTTPAYPSDYTASSISIPNQGGVKTLYFGAFSSSGASCAGGTSLGSLSNSGTGTYIGTLVLYGKFTKLYNDNTGGLYAQQIPVFAIKAN